MNPDASSSEEAARANPPLPTLWRTKLRSTLPGVSHAAQVQHCLDHGLIGIGWRIDELPNGASLDEVCGWIEEREDWGRTPAQIVRRFGAEAELGDYCWTRDTSGRYLLARISGTYRYDISDAAKKVDVHQVRSVIWAPRPLNDLEVPGGVIRRFIGVGQSFSRIHDVPSQSLTPYIWAQLNDEPLPDLDLKPEDVLTSHLDPYDVEDLVYLWLQVARNYVALPRSRQRDTPAYEWTMIHRTTRRKANVQVKTGHDQVDLPAIAAARADVETDTFAFATSGIYIGSADLVTEVIQPEDLLRFVKEEFDLLPFRTQTWFELAK